MGLKSKATALSEKADWQYIWNAPTKGLSWFSKRPGRLSDLFPNVESFVAYFLACRRENAVLDDDAFANCACCWGFLALAVDRIIGDQNLLPKLRDLSFWIGAAAYIRGETTDGENRRVWLEVRPLDSGNGDFRSYDSTSKFLQDGSVMITARFSNSIDRGKYLSLPASDFFSSRARCVEAINHACENLTGK